MIKELTERQKTVLNLVYFEEMRQQDVADYLGIKQQSVNDLLNRALKTMKKKGGKRRILKNFKKIELDHCKTGSERFVI